MDLKLLIIEDMVDSKLKFLINDLENNNIEYHIETTKDDAEIYFCENKNDIDIVIMDLAFPEKKGKDASYWTGLDIIPRLIRKKQDIIIIINTPYDKLKYIDLPPDNVIYMCQTQVKCSSYIEEIMNNNESILSVFRMLYNNNSKIAINDKKEDIER